MCGIAGIFSERIDAAVGAKMERALMIMHERGPNHRDFRRHDLPFGSALLGHTRLSIIDSADRSNQPMYSSDHRFGLIFNGEIYNYIELREELAILGRRFRTESDSEVLLAAWEAWGKQSLKRLTGMFAFAVFDFKLLTCTLVRDAFGIKPLFYSNRDKGLFFASDIRALRALVPHACTLNWQRAYDYLVHAEYDFGGGTFFKELSALPPGHLVEVSLVDVHDKHPQAWWSPSIVEDSKMTFDDASVHLRELLLDSVRLHLRSDVPLGVGLSGGIDSSAIVCAMRHLEPDRPIHTFSFISSEKSTSEEYWVDLVNCHVDAESHKVKVFESDIVRDLSDLIDTQGEPFGSSSIYAQYRVFQSAKENNITVLLDGQGADEMMGGYNGYPGQRVLSLLDNGAYGQAWSFLRNWSGYPGCSLVEGLKRVLGAATSGSPHSFLRELNGQQASPDWVRTGPLVDAGVHIAYPQLQLEGANKGRRMMAYLEKSLTERGLAALLRHGDRNSMRFSVESRVPFLTLGLAHFMLRQPEHYLVSQQGTTKALLRQALRGIVPAEVLNRRDKIGFATPEKSWITAIANDVRTWLSEDAKLPFLDQTVVCEHFDQIISGKRPYSWQVWRWINFIRWYNGHA